jgi:signal transduction histidine kinase
VPTRLRWQLTLSHLAAIAVTLVTMVAFAAVISAAWSGFQGDPARKPAQDALAIARSIAPMVASGEDPTVVGVMLKEIAAGRLRLLGAPAFWAPVEARWVDAAGQGLGPIEYVAVLRPDGSVLASTGAGPVGGSANPLRAAMGGQTSSQVVVAHGTGSQQPNTSTVERMVGSAPVLGPDGRPVAVVVVEESGRPSAPGSPALLRALAFFGVGSLVVLTLSAAFALLSAGLVGYLLSRRLVGRLERLGAGVEALAAGDLGQRVEPGSGDEVGQLARRFNAMADRLGASVGELEARRSQAEALLRNRRELVASVSHELRTPVATVRGYVESALGRDGALPADVRHDLETVQREVGRLERLIEELFTLSRAEVGHLELRIEPTDVAALVRRAVETVGPLAWRDRRVEVLAEAGEPQGGVTCGKVSDVSGRAAGLLRALVDAARLEQAIANLLSNAVRHTPPGGLVAASVDVADGRVRVRVRDTGEGIPPDELPRVFERFYRGSTAGDGAGLGLALVKELVESMGGSVAAESTPGEGSCFTLTLPAA